VADTVTPLFRIVRDDALELAIKVPETQVPVYRPGLKAILFPGNSRKGVETTVRRVSPRVDAATRMADVRITVPEEMTLPVGAFGYAEVATGEQQGLMVPQQAVLRQGGKSFVMVVDAGNIVQRRAVTILLSDGNQVMLEAASGLSPQTRLVARAGVFLRDGDLVKVAQ
jgi:RND family efflux transporter MFP subunit